MGRPRFGESEEEFDARIKRWKPWIIYIGLGLALFCCVAVFFPVGQWKPPPGVRALTCIKNLGLGALMYTNDADGRLPLASNWIDVELPYVKDESAFHSPEVPPGDGFGFAFRGRLGRADVDGIKDEEQVAMIFDSTDLRRNANGGLDLLPNPPRYGRGDRRANVVAFVDGHAKFTPRPDVVLK